MTLSTIKPFVILDRDGVINRESANYIRTPEEWQAIPGSLEAIARLNRAGFRVCVATNQSGVARGYYDIDDLDRIHEKLMYELAAYGGYIDEVFFCPHHPDDRCGCRKPEPGMLYRIQEKYGVNLSTTYFVGDSDFDIKAAKQAGCLPILVLSGRGKLTLSQDHALQFIPHFADLAAAAEYIIQMSEVHVVSS
jgi:D-glycero-D-manno-heptose 1,7-bisphosphate phosphatase